MDSSELRGYKVSGLLFLGLGVSDSDAGFGSADQGLGFEDVGFRVLGFQGSGLLMLSGFFRPYPKTPGFFWWFRVWGLGFRVEIRL